MKRQHTKFFKVASSYLGTFTHRLYNKFRSRYVILQSWFSLGGLYKYMEILFW